MKKKLLIVSIIVGIVYIIYKMIQILNEYLERPAKGVYCDRKPKTGICNIPCSYYNDCYPEEEYEEFICDDVFED